MRLLLLALLAAVPAAAKVRFLRDVKPILETHCVRCHGAERPSRGLRLDTKQRALMAIVKKKPEDSRVFNAAKSGFMPPGPEKLTAAEIETLRRWIKEGAKWPDGVELAGKNPFTQAVQ